MKINHVLFSILAIVSIVSLSLFATSAHAQFNKDQIKPHLSCVGVQYFPASGRLELNSPNEAARAHFYQMHGGNIPQIIQAVKTLGGEYHGQCTHPNSTNSGLWLPVCD